MMHGMGVVACVLAADIGQPDVIQVTTSPRIPRYSGVHGGDNPTGWKNDSDDTKTAVTAHLFHMG